MKKPKLAQTLASYNKKRAEKAKEQNRFEAMEAMSKNKAKKLASNGSTAATDNKPVSMAVGNDHVPCHIWTDSNKMQKRTRLPFHPNNNSIVLLIGEGDFSYCKALVSAFLAIDKAHNAAVVESEVSPRKWRVIATALDSRDAVLRKYRKSRDNLAFLDSIENVEILFGVDGTKLHEDRELKKIFCTGAPAPTRIIFNFPHTGAGIKDRERNIVAQQKMLKGFFDSVIKFMSARGITKSQGCTYTTTMMKKDYSIKDEISLIKKKSVNNKRRSKASDDEDDGSDEELVISDPELLACNAKIIKDFDDHISQYDEKDEGESFEIHCTLKTGDPYDSWKPKALASSVGPLCCLQSFKFCPELYSGYQHCRTIGDGRDEVVEVEGWKEFLAGKPAKTFVFTLGTEAKNSKKPIKNRNK